MRYMRCFSLSSFDGVYPPKQLYSSTYLGLLIPLNHMFTYQGSSGTGSTKCRPNIGTICQAQRFRIKPRWRTKVSNRFTHKSLFKAWFRDDLGIYTSCGCRCWCCCTLTYQSLTMMIIQNISQGSTDIFGWLEFPWTLVKEISSQTGNLRMPMTAVLTKTPLISRVYK